MQPRSISTTARAAVITLDGSAYGGALLQRLARREIPVHLVVVVENGFGRKWRLLSSVARRIGWTDASLYAAEEVAASTLARFRGASAPDYESLASTVARVGSVRSGEVPSLLGKNGIDVVLLGQSGIVPPEVLKAPRIGTLNAHPGMLPEYRGIDCAAWAIEHGDFHLVGSSLHWVDAGVDTGPVIRRMPYRWRGDETLQLLGERLYDDCITMLVDAAGTQEPGPPAPQANSGGTQYYKMPRSLHRSAKRKLRNFLVSDHRMEFKRRTL